MGYVTLLEDYEYFWRLSRIAKKFKMSRQSFEVVFFYVTLLKTRHVHVSKRRKLMKLNLSLKYSFLWNLTSGIQSMSCNFLFRYLSIHHLSHHSVDQRLSKSVACHFFT